MSDDSRASPSPTSPPALRRPRGLHPALLVLAYLLVVLAPLGLALGEDVSPRGLWRELSSALAMIGLAALLVQFLLSGRFEAISGRTGIDLTMRFHQLAAWTALAFLLAHPFLFAFARAYGDWSAALASLGRMLSSEHLRSGVVAWGLLIVLVPVAFVRDRLPVRYELWRLSHGLAALALALFAAHHTLAAGRYSGGDVPAAFWLALTAVAALSLVNVYLVKPLRQRRSPYKVSEVRPAAYRMWEVTIEPEAGPAIGFAPGQFVWLNLGHSPFSLTEHPFSLSSSPSQRPRLSFTIKESGDFTNRIGTLAPGTRAYLDGPHGNFTMVGRHAAGLVFIAGGVGLAPIMSMLRHMRETRDPRPVRLVYGNRIAEQILYADEIEALPGTLDFTVDYVVSEPAPGWTGRVGQLDFDMLRACLEGVERTGRLYFVCGPPPMMNSVEDSLRRLGVPARAVITERFKYD